MVEADYTAGPTTEREALKLGIRERVRSSTRACGPAPVKSGSIASSQSSVSAAGEQDDVGRMLGGQGERRQAVAGIADDLELRSRPQQPRQRSAHEQVPIDEQKTNGPGTVHVLQPGGR